MLNRVKQAVLGILPARVQLPLRALKQRYRGEPELALLPLLCDPQADAVDVGANFGVFSHVMRRHARSVTALEPNPRLAAFIRSAGDAKVTVVEAAASDEDGEALLRIPLDRTNNGLATIERENTLTGHPAADVAVRRVRLDSLPLGPVGFIKIDVEGHELAVMRGALRLLRTDRPTLLFEAEERHRPGAVADARALLEGLGYQGFFLHQGRIRPVTAFDPATMQDVRQIDDGGPMRRYINNFIFVHESRGPLIERLQAR